MFFVNFVVAAMFLAAWGLHMGPKTELSWWVDLLVLTGGAVYVVATVLVGLMNRKQRP